ncbi:MAG: diguanylate cyclase [Gammaproteobacteria bacterium]|jgi:two-component system cell cycle response regulator
MNILVVDHSKVFRALWNRMVLRLGHEPITVESAEEAMDILRERRIDLICTSLSLPGIDGIEFCRQLRAQNPYRNTPLILLTSTDDAATRKRGFAAGVTEIQSKTDIEALFSHARRFVQELERKVSGRVLYVEDSSVVAHVMLKILRSMELEVDHFKSAGKAFEAFQAANYDLIISDIVVEGDMSGVGLVGRVREIDGDKARVPILAISGMDDTARRIELFRLGVNDFISKPVVEEEVVARVGNLIANKQLFDQVKAQQKHLYELAMVDQLTGLYNRNSLSEFASKAFSEANRHNFDLSVVLVDVDHFKKINDEQGHLAGDSVLSHLGEMLKNICRNEDFPVRFGGEEFLLIMPHCSLEDANHKAEFIRRRAELLKPDGIPVTVSVGVTARPPAGNVSLEGLFKVADEAIYRAKQAGRNQVVSLDYATAGAA